MARGNSGPGSCVVIVGDQGDERTQVLIRLARESRIDVLQCNDVYTAAVQIARAADRRLLVAGSIRELAREDGAFFRVAAAHGVRCCCLLDSGDTMGREALLAAVRAGATILGSAQELQGVLQEWLARTGMDDPPRVARGASPAGRPGRDAVDAIYEDLRATETELDALLG